MTQVSEILVAAKKLISDPKKWIKGQAKDGDSYCATGALRKIWEVGLFGTDLYWTTRDFLIRSLPGDLTSIIHFNDDRTTTHKDIMNLFDRAIEASRR